MSESRKGRANLYCRAVRRNALVRSLTSLRAMEQLWPDTLWIVRHGESAGNVARDEAYANGLSVIDIIERDVDVPLSPAGEAQSEALGRWFARMPTDERPNVVLVSPYLRARHTASIIESVGGVAPGTLTVADERLREKEFGILDRLTKLGIEQKFPEQAEARRRMGKFYYRPPGGESWCDVILRLRSVMDAINLHHSGPGKRVLIVAHQVIVLCMRYLLEGLDEAQILAIDREGEVANCGVTICTIGDQGAMQLRSYNFVAPLEEAGAPVTTMPDTPAGAK
jgi:2,3-bisphosphoglycerate-dependent phosphoglycerate mutase